MRMINHKSLNKYGRYTTITSPRIPVYRKSDISTFPSNRAGACTEKNTNVNKEQIRHYYFIAY